MFLRGDDEFFAGDVAGGGAGQAGEDGCGEDGGEVCEMDGEGRLGVEFVDVLATGPGRAGEAIAQGGGGEADAGRDADLSGRIGHGQMIAYPARRGELMNGGWMDDSGRHDQQRYG